MSFSCTSFSQCRLLSSVAEEAELVLDGVALDQHAWWKRCDSKATSGLLRLLRELASVMKKLLLQMLMKVAVSCVVGASVFHFVNSDSDLLGHFLVSETAWTVAI